MTTSATGVRPAQVVLAWSRRLVEPALREAVDKLPAAARLIAGYHFGWWEADGSPGGLGGPAGGAGGGSGGSGGKAIRPALTLLAAEAVGGVPATALPAAVAIELVHNFSLLHDDVIDGDLTRRHRPTAWTVFGVGPAIVAGDGLLALAFDVLDEGEGAGILHRAVRELVEGQHADLAFEGRTEVSLAECVRMAEQKCGALLGAACALGAWSAGGSPAQVEQLRRFGIKVGLAFQLADDLLGIWGDPTVTGKPIYADLRRRKKSLPLVAALSAGTSAADELARLYHRDRPLSAAELDRAAGLVERAGGREWSRRTAAELLAGALRALGAAVDPVADRAVDPGLDPPGRAVAELAGLARLAAYRDR